MVMEKIFIPDIEKIARSMSRTIDRFTDLVEAISLTEEGRSCVQNVSKVAVCRAVMMELTTKKSNVILTLVADGCSGCCRTNQTRLPGLTSVQKEALRKTETFDKLLVKELKNQVRNLRQLVKKHRKLMAQDEKYRRESAKHEQKLGALLQQIHGSVPLKPRMLIFLQMKRDRVQKEMNRAKSARLTNSELEQSIRSQIKNISADLMCVITDKIKDKVEYGLEDCLLDVISKMSERENRVKAINWIRHMNVQDMTDRLVHQCSDTYVMNINAPLPEIFPNEELTLDDISSFTGSDVERSGSVCNSTNMEEVKPDSSSEAVDNVDPACGGTICRKLGFCDGNENNKFKMGLARRKPTMTKVEAHMNNDKWSPGFLKAKSGMVVRQTAGGVDGSDVGFGYYRPPLKWRTKLWGFHFVKPSH